MADPIDLGVSDLTDFVVVGSGGFSTVYAAWDAGFSRRVAVKLLHSLDETGRRRFDRERSLMGRLSDHPNVITPFRAGYTDHDVPYLVMEYVAGGSLQGLIDAEGPIPWRQAIDYLIPIGEALGHGHRNGVLHRDVKPANILIPALGTAKLADYGIAAVREATSTQMAFTLAHSPPETFSSGTDQRDERSDLYSLASTLFTTVTGRAPYQVDGEDSQLAFMRRIEEQPVPWADVGTPALSQFLRRALAKEPANRQASAKEFLDQLRTLRAAAGNDAASETVLAPNSDPTVSAPSSDPTLLAPSSDPTVLAAGSDSSTGPQPVIGGDAESPAASTATPTVQGRLTRSPGWPLGLAAVGAIVLAGAVAALLITQSDLSPTSGLDSTGGENTTSATLPTSAALSTSSSSLPEPTGQEATSADGDNAPLTVRQGVAVGVVYDIGGTGDNSSNDATQTALQQAVADYQIKLHETTTNASGSDREQLLTDQAADSDLVIAPGFEFAGPIDSVATAHPDIRFAIFANRTTLAPNVLNLVFANHEGSFLVGAAAALKSRSGRIGFLGGVNESWIDTFRAGFEAGAREVNPDIEIDARYITTSPDTSGMEDPVKAEEISLSMFSDGADVIFHVSGVAGHGLFEAARDHSQSTGTKVWAIGSFNDQYLLALPDQRDHLLTSMNHRWDVGVRHAVEAEVTDQFNGGTYILDVENDGIGYSTTGGHVDDIVDQLDALRARIISGDIVVPSIHN